MLASAALLSGAALWYCFTRGWLLYFGDAQAHLNIARRIVDSRAEALDMIGTVWLPLPHLLMLPLVGDNGYWRTGLAGAIPSAVCGALGLALFYAAARRVFGSRPAALTAFAAVALNPNFLYLQSAPMTEAVFFGCLAALFYTTVRFAESGSWWAAAGAGLAGCAAALTRYEGWLLLPLVALYLAWRRVPAALLFCLLAGLGPLAWLAHNWWQYGDVLEFFTGPHSARAIQGAAGYPGRGDWPAALTQYAAAARLCAGWPLVVAGAAGAVAAIFRRAGWAVLLLLAPAACFVWSVYSGTTPIFVPQLKPNSYYNTRYGLAYLPLAAFGAGALVSLFSGRARRWAAVLAIVSCSLPWLMTPDPARWITWKESQVNSEARRAWTGEAAAYLQENYRPGSGIFTTFGDVTGIFCAAGIPLRDTLTWDIWWQWEIATRRPQIGLREEWAVAVAGDPVQTTIQRAWLRGPRYTLQKTIAVKGAPVIEIYRRGRDWSLASLY